MHESIIAEAVRDPKFLARFWSKVDKSGECWVWTRSKNYGYGAIHIPKTNFVARANRVAWISHHGEISSDTCILHRCDNPSCCRPSHLFIGSHKDNAVDRERKGRGCIGERQGRSKLSRETVVRIREEAARGIPLNEIAAAVGVDRSNISYIVSRRTWKHVK